MRHRLSSFASLVPLAAAAMLGVLTLSGCSSDAAAQHAAVPPPAPQVTVARVISRTVTDSQTFSGRFERRRPRRRSPARLGIHLLRQLRRRHGGPQGRGAVRHRSASLPGGLPARGSGSRPGARPGGAGQGRADARGEPACGPRDLQGRVRYPDRQCAAIRGQRGSGEGGGGLGAAQSDLHAGDGPDHGSCQPRDRHHRQSGHQWPDAADDGRVAGSDLRRVQRRRAGLPDVREVRR